MYYSSKESLYYARRALDSLRREDLYVGRKVVVSELLDIPDTYIYLGDFRQLPAVIGEGVIRCISDTPVEEMDDCFLVYIPYSDWLECHECAV